MKITAITEESTLKKIITIIEEQKNDQDINIPEEKTFTEIQDMLYRPWKEIEKIGSIFLANPLFENFFTWGPKNIMDLYNSYLWKLTTEGIMQENRGVNERAIENLEAFLAEYWLKFNSDVSKYKKEQ